jgi:hypothetical protein
MHDGIFSTVISSQLHALKFAKVPQEALAPLLFNAWETPNCAGEAMLGRDLRLHILDWTKYANRVVARSFRPNCTLDSQDLLDISATNG